jgi:predicted ATPase/DNA-binding SARP family transcriptional activator
MPSLTLALLGPPRVTRADGSTVAFRSRKELALLAYLAVEGPAAQRRDTLLGLLWPDVPEESARNSLRVALANLRQAIGTAALITAGQEVQLALDGDALDVITFQQLLAACRVHRHQPNMPCAECAARLEQAVVLYRGEFLSGFTLPDAAPFEEWALVRREALHLQALDALAMLAELHERTGDYAALCRYAHRQLELEAWHEPAHRQLMRGLALAGDGDGALMQYERCRQVLADELAIEPDVETRALYERIRAGHLTPATRNATAPRHNLPASLTPFVGREAELAALLALREQPDTRLLTLVGAGGMGKTRLAIELARASLDAYADGVFFVALAPLAAAAALPAAIAQALGLTIQGGDSTAALVRFLGNKHMLLLLDNFEHLRDGVGLVVTILETAPHLQILATSRERLNMRGEQLFVIEGLPYAQGARLEDAAAEPAVHLFAQSARRSQPSFQLSAPNLPDVLQICRLVQGMPLGLELAAAWAGLLPLPEIAGEIARSAEFLAADWQDAPERQRSMRAVFEWSWALLNDVERQVFKQLAVFRGGFTRDAAQAVVGASLRGLTTLVQKSLLYQDATGRYQVHELLRQYAFEQLHAAPDEHTTIEGRHSAFYLSFVEQRAMRLARHEPQQAAAEIRTEIDNVRQAWAWAAANTRADDLDRSLYGLWQFYWLIGLSLEGEERFGLAAEHMRQASSRDGAKRSGLLSKLLAVQALFLNRQCTYDRAIQVARQAIQTGQAGGNCIGEAMGYACWGQALYRQGLMRDARSHIVHALDLSRDAQRSSSDRELLCEVELEALQWLGMLDKDAGDYQASRAHLTEALKICERLDKRREECRYLVDLGEIAMTLGDYAAATASFGAALRVARAHGARLAQGTSQLGLGVVALAEGHLMLAHDWLMGALDVLHEVGDRNYEAYTLAYLGRLADSFGDAARAQDLLERALCLSEDAGSWESRFEVYIGLSLLLEHRGEYAGACSAAQQSQKIATTAGDRARQADAWLALARAHEALQHLPEALAAYQQAGALYDLTGRTHRTTEPQAGLARIALAQGEAAEALVHIEAIRRFLETHVLAGPDEPFRIYWTCYRVLEANHDPRAVGVLRAAQQRLLGRADAISDAALRQSFLENVATHRAIRMATTAVDTQASQVRIR